MSRLLTIIKTMKKEISIQSLGGKAVLKKYGRKHFIKLSKLAALARKKNSKKK